MLTTQYVRNGITCAWHETSTSASLIGPNVKKKHKTMLFAFLGIAALLVVIHVLTVVVIEAVQLDRNRKFVFANYSDLDGSDTLVVYFSRSGNTELMAMEIAKGK